jgi:hypothetical protein
MNRTVPNLAVRYVHVLRMYQHFHSFSSCFILCSYSSLDVTYFKIESFDSMLQTLTCCTTTLTSTTTLTGRDRLEARFSKYDDGDSEDNNIIHLLCDVSRS